MPFLICFVLIYSSVLYLQHCVCPQFSIHWPPVIRGEKFNGTHSLVDWTSFNFFLLKKLQMKIWGNNGETCPKCQTTKQNETLRSSCVIPQWISSRRSAREEMGYPICGSKLTLHWNLAQRRKMSHFLTLLAFSQQGPVATSQISKRTVIDGWICSGENISLLPHV